MAHCSSIAQPHDSGLSRLLQAWLAVGFVSMLGPGVLVGFAGAFGIDLSPVPAFSSPEWIRQHSHAQMFGWIGSFIWGISLFAVPRLRSAPLQRSLGWAGWSLWTTGLAVFFAAPLVGHPLMEATGLALQTAAVILLAVHIAPPDPRRYRRVHPAIWMIATGLWLFVVAIGFELMLALQPSADIAARTSSLLLTVWIALGTITWGYAARWLPAILNLRKPREEWYPMIAALQIAAAVFVFGRMFAAGAALVLLAAATFVFALRVFEPGAGAARIRGVHASFPWFVRLAHVWMLCSIAFSALAFAGGSQLWPSTPRHLFTVGFLASMIVSIGPRMLPSFVGRIRLFSRRVMGVSMLAMAAGCSIRALDYLVHPTAPQSWFVVFASLEVAGLLLFVVNAIGTVVAVPTMTEHVAKLVAAREGESTGREGAVSERDAPANAAFR